jgi:hypothetical protein
MMRFKCCCCSMKVRAHLWPCVPEVYIQASGAAGTL